MSEDHRVPIRSAPLQHADREVGLRDRIGTARHLGVVQRIDFLPQHRALERTAGLACFLQCEAGGKHRVVQKHRIGLLALERVLSVVR